MISTFFINRPIFANVIAIVTVILGAVSVLRLPVEQYPQITPPTVQVTANYPGADAMVVANTVAAPIEQQVNGVENMIYMSSTSGSDGSYTLTVTFDIGTDVDMSTVLVQNRVSMALAQLPEEVQRQSVNTQKQSTAIILVVNLTMKEGTERLIPAVQQIDDVKLPAAEQALAEAKKTGDATAIRQATQTIANLKEDRDQQIMLYLSNYATISVHDELARIKGVGNVNIFGAAQYSMRMWLDPEKLKTRDLTTDDVVRAIKAQNVQVAAGQVGASPAPVNQAFQFTVTTLGQLEDPKQFEEIIVKTAGANENGEGGQITYLRDVARIELGAQTYTQSSYKDGKPAATLAIYQLPGANAINVAEQVRTTMKELARNFPQGIEYDIPFDTTLFVEESVHEVYKTLYEAGILVLIVIMVFLQDWRAVLIPATTVPVTIIGAFAAMYAFGFTINTLTLFGLVLAIGIVVDDAIVIVENAAHHIEQGMNPHDATIQAMSEVTGPVMGVTAVLMAVFLPTAFLGGVTGQLYRQFALTIAATAVISAMNALTLKPAQCAVYLKPLSHAKKNAFFRGFNYVYEKCEHAYTALVRFMVRFDLAMMLVFLVLIGVTMWGFLALPTGFLPVEDQGYIIVYAQLPDAASL
ncbi:MAG: efflux RND transporter permease subunit, partial [Gemmataceae bacterium]